MNIQANLNTILQSAAIAYRLSPAGEAAVEKATEKAAEKRKTEKLAKQEQSLNTQLETLNKSLKDKSVTSEEVKAGEKIFKDMQQEYVDVKQQQFNLNPNEKTAGALVKAKTNQATPLESETARKTIEAEDKAAANRVAREEAKKAKWMKEQEAINREAQAAMLRRQSEIRGSILKGTPSEHLLKGGK